MPHAAGAQPATPAPTVSVPAPEPPRPWWSVENLPLLSSLGVSSWSDIPQGGTWGGSLDATVDASRQQSRSPDGSEFKAASRQTTQGLTIRNQGFSLIDPRLLLGNASLRFGLQQSRQAAGGSETSQEGVLTGYHVDTTLLGEKPYVTNLFANRSQNLTTQISGGNTRAEYENRGMLFSWREDSILRDKEILPYFSATVQARQEHNQETTTLADRSFRRDERRSLFGVGGHNGFENADLDFQFEQTTLDNLLFPAGSYGSRTANLGYSQDFGPGRNRRWDSRLVYGSRSGASPMSNVDLTERLSIDHYQNLSTSYNYGFTELKSESGTATVHSGGMQLQHRLYNNLVSSLGVNARHQTLPTGTIDAKGAQAAFNYVHAIPGNGQLAANLAGSEQVTDSRLQSSQLAVLNAPYQAPPALGAGASILLNDSFILEDSIVVVDVRGGARLPTTPGVDYVVLVEGNRTRIVPQPTSVVILPGDPLEVSYVFNFDPSLKFQTSSRSMSLGADWRWIAVAVSHDESLQNRLSGSESFFLTDRRVDSARMELRGNWDYVRARGDAVASHYDYTTLVYDELRFSQHVSYSARENLLLGLSADQSRADYELPQRRSEARSLRLDVDWASPSGWFTNAYVSRRSLRDTQMPTDVVTEAVVRLRRRWTKLTITGALGFVERSRGGVETNNISLNASAIREF